MKKLLISLLLLTSVSVGFIGCKNKENVETNTLKSVEEENINLSKDAQEILLTYSERGMYLFKANFSSSDELSLALKTIGTNINALQNKILKNIDSKDLDISSLCKEYKDKNIIFEFLRADCPSCQEFTPILQDTIKDSDTVIVPIFTRGSKEDIDNFYKTLDIEVPQTICIDENKLLVNELGLTQVPTLVFVDKTGHISFIRTNVTDGVALKSDIKTAFEDTKLYEYKADSEDEDENYMLID